MITRLLIDADLMAYRAAAGTQTTTVWSEDCISVETDIEAAKVQLRRQIDGWMADLNADEFTICLSDDFNNFRKGVDPTYKLSRVETERPLMLYPLKDWLAERFPFDRRLTLEADDVMGILSTEPHDEKRIIVSQDKDMITIPGWLYRPFSEKPKLEWITPEQAERFHLWQTICGDTVDGYSGCPGSGPAAADRCLDGNNGWTSYQHVLKSGPRKGTEETRWIPKVFPTVWEALVSLYVKAGLTERDALVQARLARILRDCDWDGRRPIMWNPERL